MPAAAAPLSLPGSAADYQISVIRFGDSAADTVTRVQSINDTVPAYRQDITGLTDVTFAEQVDNAIAVSDGHVALEMIYLAQAAYARAPDAETFHDAFPLAYERPGVVGKLVATATDAATARGWHALSAAELDMAAADFAPSGAQKFSMQRGFYQAIDTGDTIDGDPSEGNALVFTGVVNGARVLTVTFTGTDQLADTADYANFDDHYKKFAPLVAAVTDYIDDDANGIEQVLVSGHSLGAAMVQYFMDDFDGDNRFLAWTAGSPGADNEDKREADPRTTNFVEFDDPVTYAPFLSSPEVRATVEAFIQEYLSEFPDIVAELDALIDSPLTKYRNGTDIELNPGFVVPHELTGYIAAIKGYLDDQGQDGLLIAQNRSGETVYAATGAALDDYRGTAGGDNIRLTGWDDVVLPGLAETITLVPGPRAQPAEPQIVVGNALDNLITADRGDQVLRGEGGRDIIRAGEGHDTLLGGDGNDALQGGGRRDGAGDDVFVGGAGADTMQGGSGNDTFIFRPGSGFDTIVDFSDGDVLNLRAFGLDGYDDLDGRHRERDGTVTVVLGGGDVIRLEGVTNAELDASDFIF